MSQHLNDFWADTPTELTPQDPIEGFWQDGGNTGVSEDPRGSTFGNAVSRGTDNLQASLYGAADALGRLTGVDALATWGEEGVRRNLAEAALRPAQVESWDDVDSLGALGTKVLEALGENVPNLALMATGGVAGAGTRALLAGVGKAAVEGAVKRAALAGAGAVTYPTHVGEMQNELRDAGVDSPGTAFLTAIPNTALDLLGPERMLSTAFNGLSTEMAKDIVRQAAAAYEKKGIISGAGQIAKALGGQVARGAAVGAITETPTETLQELINITARAYHDPEYDMFSEEAVSRLRNAALSGFTVGTALGGSARVPTSVRMLSKARDALLEEERKAGDQEPSPPPTQEPPPPTQESAAQDLRPEDLGPSGTVKESADELDAQAQAYLRGERPLLFIDRDPSDPVVQDLINRHGLQILASPKGGVWAFTTKDAAKAQKTVAYEAKADDAGVEELRRRALGLSQSKVELDPKTARARQTIDAQGRVAQEQVVDSKAPPPEANQRDVSLEQALRERLRRLRAEATGGISLQQDLPFEDAPPQHGPVRPDLPAGAAPEVPDSQIPLPLDEPPQPPTFADRVRAAGIPVDDTGDTPLPVDAEAVIATTEQAPALDASQGVISTSGDAEPSRFTFEPFTTKKPEDRAEHVKRFGRAAQTLADIIAPEVESVQVVEDANGSPAIEFTPLPGGVADPEVSFALTKALGEALRYGETKGSDFLTFDALTTDINPRRDGDGNVVGPRKGIRMNRRWLVRVGEYLNQLDGTYRSTDSQNLLSAVAWLEDRGLRLRDAQRRLRELTYPTLHTDYQTPVSQPILAAVAQVHEKSDPPAIVARDTAVATELSREETVGARRRVLRKYARALGSKGTVDLAEALHRVAEALGLSKARWILVDQNGLKRLVEKYPQARDAAARIEQAIERGDKQTTTVISRIVRGKEVRTPVIYVSNRLRGAKRAAAALQELGTLLEKKYLYRLPESERESILAALGGGGDIGAALAARYAGWAAEQARVPADTKPVQAETPKALDPNAKPNAPREKAPYTENFGPAVDQANPDQKQLANLEARAEVAKSIVDAYRDEVARGRRPGVSPQKSGGVPRDVRDAMQSIATAYEKMDATRDQVRRDLNEGERALGEGDFDNTLDGYSSDNDSPSDKASTAKERSDERFAEQWRTVHRDDFNSAGRTQTETFADAFAKAKTSKDQVAVLRKYARVFGSKTTATLAAAAQRALASVKLRNVDWRMADQSGIDEVAAMFEDSEHNRALVEGVKTEKPQARILYFKHRGKWRPVIYISSKLRAENRATALLHELGHLVAEHHLNSMPEEQFNALKEELGSDPMVFAENFANAFAAWVFDRKDVQDALVEQLGGKNTSGFMAKLLKAMRGIYRSLKREFGRYIPASFSKWMEEWMDGSYVSETFIRHKPITGSSANFTLNPRRIPKGRLQRILDRAGRFGERFMEPLQAIHRALIEPMDSFLRRHGLEWFANEFNRVAGKRVGRSQSTVPQQVRMEGAPFEERLNALAERAPTRLKPNPEWDQAKADLLAGRDPTTELGREFRQLYNDLHKWLKRKGVPIRFVKNYFPTVYSVRKLSEPGALERFVERVVPAIEAFNARIEQQAAAIESSSEINAEAAATMLRQQLIRDPQRYAEELHNRLSRGEAAAPMESSEDYEIIAPGFSFRKSYRLPKEVRQALTEFREDDLLEVTARYLHSAIMRGVWHERFALHDVLKDLEQRAANVTADTWEAFQEYKKVVIDHYQNKYGVNIYDPSAGLIVRLKDEIEAKNIQPEVADRIFNTVIPALQNRLGADMPLGARRMTQLAIAYQNIRLLSYGVLSQLMDAGVLAWRTGRPLQVAGTAFKALISKRTREQLLNDARLLGQVNRHLTASILNDESSVLSATSVLRRMNEGLFRWNGMHFLDVGLRSVGVAMGKTMLEDAARRGDADMLSAVGTDVESVNAWILDGMPVAYSPRHDSVLSALNQIVDESVVRPNKSHRPIWGNDQRYAVLWHMKSFMWGYHNTVLVRAWNEMKYRDGLGKALPFLTLAAYTMPLAALGMEIRWQLAPPKYRSEGGWDYFWEVIQRSGSLGVMQMLADANEAESFGKTSIVTALGPTFGQIDEIVRKNTDYDWSRALPLYPVFRTLQNL